MFQHKLSFRLLQQFFWDILKRLKLEVLFISIFVGSESTPLNPTGLFLRCVTQLYTKTTAWKSGINLPTSSKYCEGPPKLQDFTMFLANKPMQEHHISSSAIAPAISWQLLDGLIQTLSKTQDYGAPRLLSQILPALNNSLTSALRSALILVLKAAYRL